MIKKSFSSPDSLIIQSFHWLLPDHNKMHVLALFCFWCCVRGQAIMPFPKKICPRLQSTPHMKLTNMVEVWFIKSWHQLKEPVASVNPGPTPHVHPFLAQGHSISTAWHYWHGQHYHKPFLHTGHSPRTIQGKVHSQQQYISGPDCSPPYSAALTCSTNLFRKAHYCLLGTGCHAWPHYSSHQPNLLNF